jgi:hypothetical protein
LGTDWDEPFLAQYSFTYSAKRRAAEARLGFPRCDVAHPDEWVCSFQVHGVRQGQVRTARGEDGLQALVIASDAIRKSLDRLTSVSSDIAPYEIVFPRYLPFCLELDFHREVCELVDAEIKRRRRLNRRSASKQ